MTMDSSFCISKPLPVLMAAGKSPSEALSAVITTGRSRELGAVADSGHQKHARAHVLAKLVDQNCAVLGGHAEECNEPYPSRNREIDTHKQRRSAANEGKWPLSSTSTESKALSNDTNRIKKMTNIMMTSTIPN
jgi:hypothetical protein